MKKEKLVNFKVVSSEGDSKFSLVPQEALQKIRDLADNEGKWIYVDGAYTNSSDVTLSSLNNAEDITLTNIIAGGSEGTYTVNTSISEKVDKPCTINLDKKNKVISLDINSNSIKKLATHVDSIANDLHILLSKTGEDIISAVSTSYGLNPVNVTKVKPGLGTIVFKHQEDDIVVDLDLNQNILTFSINEDKKYEIINERDWYCEAFSSKIKEFVQKELSDIFELVNM